MYAAKKKKSLWLQADGHRIFAEVRSRTAWTIALALIGSCLLALPARADLITNGSFESPLAPVGGFSNFNSGSTGITGWTVVGPQVSIVSGSYTSFGLTFPAEDGNQWLDLTGDVSNNVEGVEQTVATTPGATYNLSYFVGNQVNPGGPYGTTSTVKVFVDGTLIQTSTNSLGAGGKTQVWEPFSTSFAAASASTTLEFQNADPSTDNTNGLDNVVLTQGAATATPEPSTFFMLSAALFTLGSLVIRRRVVLQ
ncbi:MAG: DUF642 domain-containing protein [Terriglobia bacterium]